MLKDSSTITNYEAFYIKKNIRGQEPLNLKTTRLNVSVKASTIQGAHQKLTGVQSDLNEQPVDNP